MLDCVPPCLSLCKPTQPSSTYVRRIFLIWKKIYALSSKVSIDDTREAVVDVMICDMRSNNDLSMWQNMNVPNSESKLNKMNSCV